jgi:DNA-binding NarL/FixJ family response regulator
LRIGVLARPEETQERWEMEARSLGGTETCDPSTGSPHIILLVAHSPRDVVVLSNLVPDSRVPRVIMDLVGDVDERIAVLHGALGYFTEEAAPQRQLECLRNVAAGTPDAPDPHSARFHRELRRGPLDPQQRSILEMSAAGATHETIGAELKLHTDTLDRRIATLRRRLDLARTQPLPAAAIRLGFEAG